MFHKDILKLQNHVFDFVIVLAISGKSFSFSGVSVKKIVKEIKLLGTTKAKKRNYI